MLGSMVRSDVSLSLKPVVVTSLVNLTLSVLSALFMNSFGRLSYALTNVMLNSEPADTTNAAFGSPSSDA